MLLDNFVQSYEKWSMKETHKKNIFGRVIIRMCAILFFICSARVRNKIKRDK